MPVIFGNKLLGSILPSKFGPRDYFRNQICNLSRVNNRLQLSPPLPLLLGLSTTISVWGRGRTCPFLLVYFSHRRSARIKKLIQRKLTKAPKNQGQTPFQTPSAILGPPGGHFEFLRFSQKEWSDKETYLAKNDRRVK